MYVTVEFNEVNLLATYLCDCYWLQISATGHN